VRLTTSTCVCMYRFGIPSNAVAVCIVSLWTVLQPELRARHSSPLQYAILLVAPLFSLTVYLPHWDMMILHSTGAAWSSWGRAEILLHWLETITLSALAIAVFFILGCAVTVLGLSPSRANRPTWLLLAIAVVACTTFILITPRPAFPRTLLAVSPLIYLGIAPVAALGLTATRLRVDAHSRSFLWCVGLVFLTLFFSQLDAVKSLGDANRHTHNLRQQSYNVGFSPAQTLSSISALTGNTSTTIYTDVNSWQELSYSAMNQQLPLRILSIQKLDSESLTDSSPSFLVTRVNRKLEDVTSGIAGNQISIILVSKDQYYAVYQIIGLTPAKRALSAE
jgi:hypothetical protein